jgi:hypothetical protein
MDFDEAKPEAIPRKAHGNAADMARNDRREKLKYGMDEILRLRGKQSAAES